MSATTTLHDIPIVSRGDVAPTPALADHILRVLGEQAVADAMVRIEAWDVRVARIELAADLIHTPARLLLVFYAEEVEDPEWGGPKGVELETPIELCDECGDADVPGLPHRDPRCRTGCVSEVTGL